MRKKLLPVAAFAVVALLFEIANRGAYKGFFADDSLDNLAFTRALSYGQIARGLVVPEFYANNFRPVGHLFFKIMGAAAGLRFPAYVAALHFLHLTAACLLFVLLLRVLRIASPAMRSEIALAAASAGALFFVFHMALFSVLWEPMYVFDLLCGLLCLISLLAYVEEHWILSFIAFWFAYRSKEVAVMLPAVLLAYEFVFGGRRWKRLLPFFAVSAVISIQALLRNTGTNNDYTLRFDPASIWTCIQYYAGKIFLVPLAGFALVAAALWFRSRMFLFGLSAFCAFLLPMLFLPARLSPSYMYVPLTGAAICIACIALRYPRRAVAILLLVWLPWNYANLRRNRRAALAEADSNRAYISVLADVSRRYPGIHTYVFDGPVIHRVGVDAALRWFHPGQHLQLASLEDEEGKRMLQSGPSVVLAWFGHLAALPHPSGAPDAPYVNIGRSTPVWQLEDGWYTSDGSPYRWIAATATARLARPAGATQFELNVNVGPALIAAVHRTHLHVLLDGTELGAREFDRPGWQTLRWHIPSQQACTARVRFDVAPVFKPSPDAGVLGIALGSFGFIAQ